MTKQELHDHFLAIEGVALAAILESVRAEEFGRLRRFHYAKYLRASDPAIKDAHRELADHYEGASSLARLLGDRLLSKHNEQCGGKCSLCQIRLTSVPA